MRLMIFAGASAALFALARASNGFESGPVLCPFRALTDLPCPLCGTTRSVGNLLLGDFEAALAFNPLGIAFAIALVGMLLLPRNFNEMATKVERGFTSLTITYRALSVIGIMTSAWILNIPRML